MTASELLDLSKVARVYRETLGARALHHHQRHNAELARLLAQGSEAAGEVAEELVARAMFVAAMGAVEGARA